MHVLLNCTNRRGRLLTNKQNVYCMQRYIEHVIYLIMSFPTPASHRLSPGDRDPIPSRSPVFIDKGKEPKAVKQNM